MTGDRSIGSGLSVQTVRMVGGHNVGNGYNAIIGLTDTAYEENLKGVNQRG
jgi:hypothetical protein